MFSFLYHYLIDGVGVFGYDPIQGALSPPLRVLCHISSIFILWGLSMIIQIPISLDDVSDTRQDDGDLDGVVTTCSSLLLNLPMIVWFRGILAFSVYLLSFYVFFYVMDGVSVPAGPRPHKIQRIPQWENKTWELTNATDEWRCVTASEAHAVTEAEFFVAGTTSAAALTGEPSGRDVWTTVAASSSKQRKVDEAVVQEMASGGRPAGFNPHVNPNRYVIYYRVRACIRRVFSFSL